MRSSKFSRRASSQLHIAVLHPRQLSAYIMGWIVNEQGTQYNLTTVVPYIYSCVGAYILQHDMGAVQRHKGKSVQSKQIIQP